MTLLPDFFLVDIYNLTGTDAYSLKNNKTLTVIGRDGGMLCTGEVDDIYTHLSDTNTITTVSVIDGKSFWESKINKSFGGGTTVETTLRNIISGASMGAFIASDVRMIRGQTYNGRLAECVSELAKSVHGRAYITNGTVYVTTKGRSAETVRLSEDDVIVQDDTATGVRMIKTQVKGFPIGSLIELDGRKYRLVSQKFDADNFEGPWDTYLILVDEQQISPGGMEGG